MRKFLVLLLLLGPVVADDDESEIEIDVPPPPEKKAEPKPKPTPIPVPPESEKPVEPKATLQERINLAIDRGVDWLKKRQNEDGSYGPCVSGSTYGSDVRRDKNCYLVGPTAFTVFTLRKCGVPRKDPVIKKALKWLRKRCRRGWNPDLPRVDGTQFRGKDI